VGQIASTCHSILPTILRGLFHLLELDHPKPASGHLEEDRRDALNKVRDPFPFAELVEIRTGKRRVPTEPKLLES
jgi:hypothetical protein